MTNYHQHAADIVAYTHTAEMLCPGCVASRFSPDGRMGNAEEVLDVAARKWGINRHDETTYDSGDFPKVVFADQLNEDECCGWCGGEL